MVSGVGTDSARAAGPAASAYHDLRRVVTNLAVLDFGGPDGTMRLLSLHPGVTLERVPRRHRLRAVHVEGEVPATRDAERRGAAPHPRGHRPARAARPRDPGMSRARGLHPALRTRVTDLFGMRYPIVQTGMGYVSDARLTTATANAGGLGILAAGLMSYDELVEARSRRSRRGTDAPFGVNLRADQPDVVKRIDLLDLGRRQGRLLRAGPASRS